MKGDLLHADLRESADVFAVRQFARQVAEAVHLDGPDQVRVATAVSEVARELVANQSPATVVFRVDTEQSRLAVDIRTHEPVDQLLSNDDPVSGLAGARRLMDDFVVDTDSVGRMHIGMTKPCPAAPELTVAVHARLRRQLAAATSAGPLEELRQQNQELLATLEDLQRKRDELLRLNSELQETNAGVMALYASLSEELESTNIGVVALYAELDDRSNQLRHASEVKSRFLAHVSHELRTPATAIIAIADLLLNDPDSALTGESQHAVTLVRTSAWDMLSMVNELLDVAKVEAGQVQPELRKVELHSLLGQLRGTLRPLVTSPDVQLLIEEPTDIKMLDTDDTLLTQILRNLLANALKFTDRGTVRLQVEAASHGRVRFAVADTGIGISREDQVRIFEEFYQVPNLAQVRWHGTGLGLPYAKRLVDLLGGTLTVESELGSGSVFTVELPGLDETVAAGDRVGAASSG